MPLTLFQIRIQISPIQVFPFAFQTGKTEKRTVFPAFISLYQNIVEERIIVLNFPLILSQPRAYQHPIKNQHTAQSRQAEPDYNVRPININDGSRRYCDLSEKLIELRIKIRCQLQIRIAGAVNFRIPGSPLTFIGLLPYMMEDVLHIFILSFIHKNTLAVLQEIFCQPKAANKAKHSQILRQIGTDFPFDDIVHQILHDLSRQPHKNPFYGTVDQNDCKIRKIIPPINRENTFFTHNVPCFNVPSSSM